MQDYIGKSISDVVNEINDHYFLPDIQRDFVWKPEQVYLLFDSLLRDYPISTFLLWNLKGDYLQEAKIKKLEFVKTSKEKNRENTEINREKEYHLVLDGQQRLTSFFLVLKGNYIIRNRPYDLFFNVLSGIEENDGILYEFEFFNKDREGVSPDFDEKDKKKIEKIWFRVKDIYDIKDIEEVSDILSDKIEKQYSISLASTQKKAVTRLLRMLKYEKVIHYYPEVEKNYDKVLDIFVRTNSGGTKLSYSDLLFSTIKSQWAEARDKFGVFLTSVNKGGNYDFSNDFILKTILVIEAKNAESVKYRTKNFDNSLIGKIKEDDYWKKLTSSISLAVDLLSEKFYLTHHKLISSDNALIPIIYALFKNNIKGFGAEKNCLADEQIKTMRVWFIKGLISGVFAGQSDNTLFKCKEAIDASKELFPANEIENKIRLETKKRFDIDPSLLDRIVYQGKNSHLILSICYKHAINYSPKMQGNTPEQDHIFSQDELEKAKIDGNKVNSIYNIRYIGSSENKIKSANKFETWMKEIGKNETELKKHLIPRGDWNPSQYERNNTKSNLNLNMKSF